MLKEERRMHLKFEILGEGREKHLFNLNNGNIDISLSPRNK